MTDEKDHVGSLLRAAGRRIEPSPEALVRMRAHVHGEWQATLAARKHRRWYALAASVLAVVGAGTLFLAIREQVAPAKTGQIIAARITHGGELLAIDRNGVETSADSDPELVAVGNRVHTGANAGALLVQLPRGTTTLRMDRNSTLEWLAPDRLRLVSGRLYVDTGHAAAGAAKLRDPLVIEAAGARIEHVGTQFVTVVSKDLVTVGVRDGLVKVMTGAISEQLARGERAAIRFDASQHAAIQREPFATSGEGWRWADELAPRLSIEGRDLVVVLRALAYQAGLTLNFANAQIEADARGTILHGPALDMAPDAALQAILATTSFRSSKQAGATGELLIQPR
ncbi:MAG: FecR family protein [Steroidobacteraceae bacterium]